MNINLKARLYEKMDEWVNEESEGEYWPNIYEGGKTSDLMAEAASAVFDAVVEFQKYAEEDGIL